MNVWLPYLVGAIIFIAGLATIISNKFSQQQGLEKVVALAPVFLAVPIAIFGTEHFTAAKFVARMVPAWIPGHLFWAIFVGVCLVSAAVSIALRKFAWLAATLLGTMVILFVLLIHLPNIAGAPGSRMLWLVGTRDLVFAGGILCFAATQTASWGVNRTNWMVTSARLWIGALIIIFGVQQFLHLELAPGVPLDLQTPLWMPAHWLWGYLGGAVFVVTGLCLLSNWKARATATWLGLAILAFVLLLYVPIVVANPSNIASGLNSLADTLLLSGAALALAGALPRNPPLDPATLR